MSDPYSSLASQDKALQEQIADALEARCLDPAQVQMRREYLEGLTLPSGSTAVELGSGTGHVTRDLLEIPEVSRAMGIEASDVLVARANQAFSDHARISFQTGDARSTGLEDASVDLVVMHTLLCHVPDPEDALKEADRILKPGGILAICDGDYDTATAKISDFDPVDQLVRFMINQNVTNLWIMREIAGLLNAVGFELGARRGHSYVADSDAVYFKTVIDRGADRMAETGVLRPETAEALKAEARSRIAAGTFFGFMSYVSQIARKPLVS